MRLGSITNAVKTACFSRSSLRDVVAFISHAPTRDSGQAQLRLGKHDDNFQSYYVVFCSDRGGRWHTTTQYHPLLGYFDTRKRTKSRGACRRRRAAAAPAPTRRRSAARDRSARVDGSSVVPPRGAARARSVRVDGELCLLRCPAARRRAREGACREQRARAGRRR